MRVSWFGRDNTGRCGLEAVPGIYDGVPVVSRLFLDREISKVNDDVLGVASVLAFASYLEGPLELPKPVSPEAANAIEEFLSPAAVRVSNVNYDPFSAPSGEANIYLDYRAEFSNPIENRWGVTRTSCLSVLDATKFNGGLFSIDGVAVASNARVISDLGPRSLSFAPFLSVGLMFAETLQASTIYVNESMFVSSEMLESASRLLEGCNIRLIGVEPEENLSADRCWLV